MGALTLKSFPFELRGWDIEKFESFDPTDSFGSNTRVYVSKSQVVLIEPDYNNNTFNTWLTDKGRQFFDGIFNTYDINSEEFKSKDIKKNFWSELLKKIIESAYIADHCNKQSLNIKFFTIVVENVSLEVLNILLILSQNYSFIKLRRAENVNIVNNLETNFQLNVTSDKNKLSYSTLCLLISNNPRYEGYYLNINLRQRYLKGNFKCLSLGSILDLSFPVSFLGSNIKILKTIAEGNSLICQDFKTSKNPVIIYNSDLFKRTDSSTIIQILNSLNYSSTLNKLWNGLNMLSSSLSENNMYYLSKIPALSSKDLNSYSTLYFINLTTNNAPVLKKITELNLLNYSINVNSVLKDRLILDQNYKAYNNLNFFNKLKNENNFTSYEYLPTSVFYENEETFLNTEGFLKRTVKLISRKKTRNNWQILRKLLKNLKKNLVSLDRINNKLIFFNSNRLINFKNFIHFHYYAVQTLTNLNFYLTLKTNPVFFLNNNINFKKSTKKMYNTKLKYWLDDFFTSGKDEYSHNSLLLTNCSKIIRLEQTNFF
jgi:NADH dehydrogenase/NADH:ubiquinone oxidoreductase subunit G